VLSEVVFEIAKEVTRMSVVPENFSWHFNSDEDKENHLDDYRSERPVRMKKKSLKVRETRETVTSQLQS